MPPGISVPLTLLVQWLLHGTGIVRKYYGVVFGYLHQILQLFVSFSVSDYYLKIGWVQGYGESCASFDF